MVLAVVTIAIANLVLGDLRWTKMVEVLLMEPLASKWEEEEGEEEEGEEGEGEGEGQWQLVAMSAGNQGRPMERRGELAVRAKRLVMYVYTTCMLLEM